VLSLVEDHVAKVERLKQQLERFRSLAARVPETEVELAKLNRDYDVLKIKHSELLSRREQAKISRDRDLGADRTAYEILDAARVPAIPDGPPRAVMIIAVFVASLIAGVGFAVLLSFTNTAFNDPKHLREAFGIAVLGTVSMVHSHAQRGWQVAKLSSFAGCLLLLVVSLGALLYADRTLEIDQLRPSELGRQGIDAVLSLVGTEK